MPPSRYHILPKGFYAAIFKTIQPHQVLNRAPRKDFNDQKAGCVHVALLREEMRRFDDFGRHVNRRAAKVAVEELRFSGHCKMEIVDLSKVFRLVLHVDSISL